jgi:hypothetical protein
MMLRSTWRCSRDGIDDLRPAFADSLRHNRRLEWFAAIFRDIGASSLKPRNGIVRR